ncbi:MAG: BamA/TamA family outer membrane protein, partial [Bdellovibrionota bacterium]
MLTRKWPSGLWWWILPIAGFWHAAVFAGPNAVELCPRIVLSEPVSPGLSDVEKRLLCGDPERDPGVPNEAWRAIPSMQARYFLKNFLEERGYLHPEFRQEEGHTLVVPGKKARVMSLEAEGAPPALHLEHRRQIVGEVLTPSLLSTVEKWVASRLQEIGFACPVVKAEGDPESGKILVHVKPGEIQTIIDVLEEPIDGVLPGILRRYDAFKLGEPFDGDLLTITEARMMGQNVVETAHFTATCSPKGVVLRQEVVPGPPRIVSFGLGANTEGLIVGRASWRNTRLGKTASWIDVTAQASVREQTLSSSLNWYFYPHPTRVNLNPVLQITHENQLYYETLTGRGQLSVVHAPDFRYQSLNLAIGPTIDYYRTFRGVGPRDFKLLSLEARALLKSHEFEYYSGNPRTGYNIGLVADLNTSAIVSDVSAQRLTLRGETLWNFRTFDPPLWVVGFRAQYSTILTAEPAGPQSRLPASILQYLGGSKDLRGWGLQELPNQFGALTSAFASLEFRLANTLPFNVEPFTFFDAGVSGTSPGVPDS